MEANQYFVDLLLGVMEAGFEGPHYVAQHGFQLFVLGRQGLQAAVRRGEIADHLAVVRFKVYVGSQCGEGLALSSCLAMFSSLAVSRE